MTGSINSQSIGEIVLDCAVPLMHLVSGRFQVIGLHAEDGNRDVEVAAPSDEAVDHMPER